MKKFFLLASAFLFLGSAIGQTTIVDSIFAGGMYRDYRLYIPAIYNASNPVPLILNLHGYTSNNAQQEAYADFRPIADTANFILVHPNGTYDQYNYRHWNCWTPIGTGVNDVGFLSALIDSISASYNIDAERIYSTGLSNGGFMSNDLACFLGNRITAIASVAAGLTSIHRSACNPSHPTPVMEIHGTADATVPYNGGTGMLHVDTVIKFWAQFNQCSMTPVITSVPNVNTTDGCTADNHLYSNGALGSTVELYKIQNGGHSWPGAISIPALGNTNQDFKATVEIWRFFRKYTLSSLVSGTNETLPVADIKIFPVPFEDELNISASADSEIRSIRIFDLSGKLVICPADAGSQNSFRLKTDLLQSGFYILEAESGNMKIRKKIMKF